MRNGAEKGFAWGMVMAGRAPTIPPGDPTGNASPPLDPAVGGAMVSAAALNTGGGGMVPAADAPATLPGSCMLRCVTRDSGVMGALRLPLSAATRGLNTVGDSFAGMSRPVGDMGGRSGCVAAC